MLSAEITGLTEAKAMLKELSVDVRKKSGRFALRKAAALVLKAAKSNASSIDDPATRESIKDNLVIRWSSKRFKSSQGTEMGFRVGVLGGARAPKNSKQDRATMLKRRRGGYKSLEELGELAGKGKDNPGGDTYYWRFIEFGTEKMPAKPFMRNSLANNIESATNEFSTQFNASLTRAVKKAKKAR